MEEGNSKTCTDCGIEIDDSYIFNNEYFCYDCFKNVTKWYPLKKCDKWANYLKESSQFL